MVQSHSSSIIQIVLSTYEIEKPFHIKSKFYNFRRLIAWTDEIYPLLGNENTKKTLSMISFCKISGILKPSEYYLREILHLHKFDHVSLHHDAENMIPRDSL